jgi:hypothetical protein
MRLGSRGLAYLTLDATLGDCMLGVDGGVIVFNDRLPLLLLPAYGFLPSVFLSLYLCVEVEQEHIISKVNTRKIHYSYFGRKYRICQRRFIVN